MNEKLVYGGIGIVVGVAGVVFVAHVFKPTLFQKIRSDVTARVIASLSTELHIDTNALRNMVDTAIAQPVASAIVDNIP